MPTPWEELSIPSEMYALLAGVARRIKPDITEGQIVELVRNGALAMVKVDSEKLKYVSFVEQIGRAHV